MDQSKSRSNSSRISVWCARNGKKVLPGAAIVNSGNEEVQLGGFPVRRRGSIPAGRRGVRSEAQAIESGSGALE